MYIPLIITLFFLFTCCGLAIREARRLVSRYPDLKIDTLHRRVRYLAAVLGLVPLAFALILIPLMNKTWLWNVPVWFDLYAIHLSFSVATGCFAFLFTLVVKVAQTTRHPESKKIMAAAILIVAVFPLFQYQYTHPVYPELKDIRLQGVVLQSHSSTCAAASGANVAKALGLSHTEKEMAREMRTSNMIGTNAGQIIHAMDRMGVRCVKKWVKDSDASRLQAPAFLFIDSDILGPESHAVAFMGQRDGVWEVWDPLEGRRFFPSGQLRKIWSGKGLECSLAGNGGSQKKS